MHVQSPIPGWIDALPFMPNGGLVLSVDNPGVLADAKRINPKLLTAYRKFFNDQDQFILQPDYPTAVEHARLFWKATVLDGAFLRDAIPHIDLLLECNEYYDQGMATNSPDAIVVRHRWASAVVNVWNDEYRGRHVYAHNGEGDIPANLRVVIGNSPVGNNIPKVFAELAISTDNVLGYHPYVRASVTQWPGVVRDPGDWRYHSGRWNFMEQAWGLGAGLRWAFTEYGPYMGSTEGWRHASVLGGNQALLLAMHRAWHTDMQGTDAYKTGRATTSAWFSIGGNWTEYLLEKPQLVEMAKISRELWHPGQEQPMPTPDEAAKITAAIAKLDEARAILQPLAVPKHTLANLTNQGVFNLFQKAFGPNYFAKVTVACDEAYMLAHRPELYHGAAIEDMPGLTAAEKAALIAAL